MICCSIVVIFMLLSIQSMNGIFCCGGGEIYCGKPYNHCINNYMYHIYYWFLYSIIWNHAVSKISKIHQNRRNCFSEKRISVGLWKPKCKVSCGELYIHIYLSNQTKRCDEAWEKSACPLSSKRSYSSND